MIKVGAKEILNPYNACFKRIFFKKNMRGLETVKFWKKIFPK
jgi:hypothetical protein